MVKDHVWEGKAEPESIQKGKWKGIFSSYLHHTVS